ncbi:MAG: NPCBM/NEW2 domain-containing protein [Asticcacaulis sp.]
MPRKLRALAAASLFALAFSALTAVAQDDPLTPSGRWTAVSRGAAKTPPMGWNSWNAFRTEINEDKVMGAAKTLKDSGLAKLGYVYVNIDDGWWLKRRTTDGRLEIRTAIFPGAQINDGQTSFRPFVDRLHSMGLKAGIYTDIGRNACSQAWDLHSPNLPVGTTAEREVGLEDHVDQDIRLFFKDWGFDYVKVDACGLADFTAQSKLIATQGYRPREALIIRKDPAQDHAADIRAMYERVSDALETYNPDGDYVLSICTWGRGEARRWGQAVGNSWRTSVDIRATWPSMLDSYDSVVTRPLYARPGAWNDPDMLFIGAKDFDTSHLTEARSHFSLWVMINAPLLIGYDLRDAPQSLLDIWGNAELIAVNQDKAGHQATLAYRSGEADILVKSLSTGKKAVALFNRTNKPIELSLSAKQLKFADTAPVSLRNLWSRDTLPAFRGEKRFTLAAHETLVFEASGKPRISGVYLSEVPARIHIAAETPPSAESGPENEWNTYGGWGGPQPDATPYSTGLSIAGKSHAYGIGALSGSRMEVRTDGQYRRFAASVGVDDVTRNRTGAVQFRLYGDGRLLGETGPMRFGDKAQNLTGDLRGVKVVELISLGEDAAPVAVSWADARFEH